jgi:hypothetical protein
LRAERPRLASIVMRSSQRPLLLVDVDGVISLFGFAAAPPAGLLATAVDGIPHLLSDRAGPLLERLSGTFECVWCTGWEERAEEHLPRLLGLPGGWPHLRFAPLAADALRHWKLDSIEACAGSDRPVAWIDDAFDATCEAWVAARPGPTLLVRTEPASGLTPAHVARLEAWAEAALRVR